jgi:hypothetical protein
MTIAVPLVGRLHPYITVCLTPKQDGDNTLDAWYIPYKLLESPTSFPSRALGTSVSLFSALRCLHWSTTNTVTAVQIQDIHSSTPFSSTVTTRHAAGLTQRRFVTRRNQNQNGSDRREILKRATLQSLNVTPQWTPRLSMNATSRYWTSKPPRGTAISVAPVKSITSLCGLPPH